MSVIREEVEALLDRCQEDIPYHLYVVEKVRHGLEAAEFEGTLTQEQAEEKLGKWLIG